jgi:phosphoenolpyruvate carboxykinase (ATP)
MTAERLFSSYGLDKNGITNVRKVHWNHNTPMLYEDIIKNNEGHLTHNGPVITRTGLHTGRAAKDKFIVEEEETRDHIWWGKVNKAITPSTFENMFRRLQAYLQDRDVWVQDCFAGADPRYRMPIRVVTVRAWHSLFARNMFIQAKPEDLTDHIPDFTIIHAPSFQAIPEVDGTNSEAFILLNLRRKLVLIGGTSYAGEIKKSIFTVLNYRLPELRVLPMHCSANVGDDGDVAIFFGLSGTGKTTLSADPNRRLIGDDEHGWSDNGVFNFEGGCYAKVIRLSEESEPEIYATTEMFGTILENVGYDVITRRLDLDDDSQTADAFGVLPPIARLTPEQAMYHFVSGYTAKVAGTEAGITEPSATFSACFGAPFMVRPPAYYAELLAEKIRAHGSNCWLVNTGWTGGPYGAGHRMPIQHTRALLNSALDGSLADVAYEEDPVFGLHVPTSCPGVPSEVLRPRDTWKDPVAYDAKAQHLAALFQANFEQFANSSSDEIKNAGPKKY